MTKPAVFATIAENLRAYWKSDRWTLLPSAELAVLAASGRVIATQTEPAC